MADHQLFYLDSSPDRLSSMQPAWILAVLLCARALVSSDAFLQRAGRVSWLPTEELLDSLKGSNTSDDLRRTFNFDETEGNWTELQTLFLGHKHTKVVVLMTDSRQLPQGGFAATIRGTLPYWVSSVYINLLYALRHQYDFMRVDLPSQGLLRHSSWYKLQVIRVLLERYDNLVYLDSDAFFLSQDRTVGSLVAEFDLEGAKHLLLPENGLCCETANTGVMLWRRSPEAFKILEDWWLCPRYHPDSLTSKAPGKREQGCFERGGVYAANKDIIALSNSTYLTTPEGTVVRHYWSTLSADQRNNILQDAAAKIFMNEFRNYILSDSVQE